MRLVISEISNFVGLVGCERQTRTLLDPVFIYFLLLLVRFYLFKMTNRLFRNEIYLVLQQKRVSPIFPEENDCLSLSD